MSEITIRQVGTDATLGRDFVELPLRLYRDDPN